MGNSCKRVWRAPERVAPANAGWGDVRSAPARGSGARRPSEVWASLRVNALYTRCLPFMRYPGRRCRGARPEPSSGWADLTACARLFPYLMKPNARTRIVLSLGVWAS